MFAVYPVMGHIGKSNIATFFFEYFREEDNPSPTQIGGKAQMSSPGFELWCGAS
jgi:hypothetical protein